MVAAILTDSRALLYPLRKYLFARLADGRNKHARQVCAGANLRTPLAIARKVRYPSASAKQKRACFGLRSALCNYLLFTEGSLAHIYGCGYLTDSRARLHPAKVSFRTLTARASLDTEP